MQQKYLEHYAAMVFHKWLMKICDQVGDAPFRSVVQNFMYYQDPEDPYKVRLQSFITGLLAFLEQAKDLADPDPAPPLTVVELDKRLARKANKEVLGGGVALTPAELASFNLIAPSSFSFMTPEKPLDKT